ncbi:hypothetical protein [Desertibacillus haloalkaliphilus]|uniref:hypothetical protein n=1 Tax=Desertibacillus haloalkaliphilus TaxID=1328930 RepID=UPI001C27F220|nr:hypothetical protein [Desertibacillus haloalkaliphilus]MBU8906635.1 hypothetical protein [Desertibacillus haloalkaliphilus]
MEIIYLFVIAVVVGVVTWFEWPKIEKHETKEKRAFIAISAIAVCLAAFLLYFPDAPGPTHFVSKLFEPLTKMIK